MLEQLLISGATGGLIILIFYILSLINSKLDKKLKKIILGFLAIIIVLVSLFLILATINVKTGESIISELFKSSKINNIISNSECALPAIWDEVGFIHKKCQLKEIEKLSGYQDTFNTPPGNGRFDYCNTLIFRKYSSLRGDLYTYEKVRYQHYPMSEVGEYVMPEGIYETIANSRKCDGDINDNTVSSESFPSRNVKLNEYSPCFWSSLFFNEYAWSGTKKHDCYSNIIEVLSSSNDPKARLEAVEQILNRVKNKERYLNVKNLWPELFSNQEKLVSNKNNSDSRLEEVNQILDRVKNQNEQEYECFGGEDQFLLMQDLCLELFTAWKVFNEELKYYDMTEIFYSPITRSCLLAYWSYVPAVDDQHYNTRHIIRDLNIDKIIFYRTDVSLWKDEVSRLKRCN